MRSSAASRNCRGSIAPWGRASRTRRWSRAISAIRGELDARSSRSMSARPCALQRLQRGADHSWQAADVFELRKPAVLKRSRNTGVECLAVRKATEAACKTRSEQGQSQDFQSDFVRLGCLKTPHSERQRTIHQDKTSYHDPFSLSVIDDGAVGLW